MVLAVVSAMAVCGWQAPPTAKLAWHEFDENDVPFTRNLPAYMYGIGTGTPAPAGYTTPAGIYGAAYFTVRRAARQTPDGESHVWGVIGSTKPGGEWDRLWVDWNGDTKFDGAEGAKPVAAKNPRWQNGKDFAFSAAPKGPNGPIHLRITVVGKEMYTLAPTGCMRGVLDLNGKRTEVSVIDADCDGAFDGKGRSGPSDLMAVGAGAAPVPILALVQQDDGTFWEPTISPDGRTFQYVKDTSPTGTISFEGSLLAGIGLSSAKGPITVKQNMGRVTVPAGAYTITSAMVLAKDEKGMDWQLMIAGYNAPKIEVPAGGTVAAKVGVPLKLAVAANRNGAEYVFGLELKDVGGNAVQGIYSGKGERPAAPSLVITDTSGKVVKTTAFAYG